LFFYDLPGSVQSAHDDAQSFRRNHLDLAAFLDHLTFTDYIHTLSLDERGAGWP
jgi:hypothetical protein